MNEAVTVTFVPEQIITWLLVGLVAGLLASLLIRGARFGVVSSIVVGLFGALLGGFLFSLLGIQLPPALAGGITLAWGDIFISFIGAVIILLLFGGYYRSRRVL